MIPESDLFNEVRPRDGGFYTIKTFEESPPVIHVYAPDGNWCGCTNATGRATQLAAIRQIIRYYQNYLNHEETTEQSPTPKRNHY